MTIKTKPMFTRKLTNHHDNFDNHTKGLWHPLGYNTNTYKKPEPLTYIRFELLLPTTEGWGYTII